MTKYDKFIILYTSNFCERIDDFFCIKKWLSHGYDLEYWDLSAITCHEHLADYHIEGLTIREVNNYTEFEGLIREVEHKKALFMTWVNYCWYSAKFYEILTKYNCDYAFFDNGLIPSFDASGFLSKLSIRTILKSLQGRYYNLKKRTKALKPANFYFRITNSYQGVDKVDSSTRYGWCNSGDYERYQKLTNVENNDYVVFLDQYIPYHNDNILNGRKQIDPDKYYNALNNVFSLIEERLGLPVIIAAHPAAKNYVERNPFNGRLFEYNKTAELVKGCKFVVAHFTTAISFVVLGQKKMILLTSDAITATRPDLNDYILKLGQILDLMIINIDQASSSELPVEINRERYDSYKYMYLTNKESENRTNFENICHLLDKDC